MCSLPVLFLLPLLLLLQVLVSQAFLLPVLPSTTTTTQRRTTNSRRHLTVGGEDPSALDTLKTVWDVSTGIGALVVGGLVVAEVAKDRPRGWVNEQLVEPAQSTLGPQAGRGLFTLCDIPKGTVIGNFPGVVSPRTTWLQRKDSEEAAIFASRYTWTLGNGDILDPTLANGQLPERLYFLGGLIRLPTLLALVNEPPVGVDVNLSAVVTDTDVAYKAERNIYQGEELFIGTCSAERGSSHINAVCFPLVFLVFAISHNITIHLFLSFSHSDYGTQYDRYVPTRPCECAFFLIFVFKPAILLCTDSHSPFFSIPHPLNPIMRHHQLSLKTRRRHYRR